MAPVGFFAGLRRWKTLGAASLPCTARAFVDGAERGYEFGKNNFVGKRINRELCDDLEEMVSTNTGIKNA